MTSRITDWALIDNFCDIRADLRKPVTLAPIFLSESKETNGGHGLFFFLHDLYDLLRNNSTKATTRQKEGESKKKGKKRKGEETKRKIGDTKGLNKKRKEKEKKEKED